MSDKHSQDKAWHGMRYVRHKVAALIPEGVCYVEPFAGHAWVAREVCKGNRECILGDIDPKPLEWAKDYHKIEGEFKVQDWRETVKEAEGRGCVFLFDPPHNRYGGNLNRRKGDFSEKDYFPEIAEFCKKHKCIINLPPDRKEFCDIFNCHEFTIIQGKKEWKYLIAENLGGWDN